MQYQKTIFQGKYVHTYDWLRIHLWWWEVCISQVTESKVNVESKRGPEGVNAPVEFQSISNDLATRIKSGDALI